MTPEQIKAMSAAEIAESLTEHNKWRRGEGEYDKPYSGMPYSAQAVGAIIDRAVELLNEQKATIEQIKLDILNLIDSEYDLAHGSDIRKVLKEVCNG